MWKKCHETNVSYRKNYSVIIDNNQRTYRKYEESYSKNIKIKIPEVLTADEIVMLFSSKKNYGKP